MNNPEENKQIVKTNNVNITNPVEETAELLGAVGDLSRDAYVGAVRQTRSFITFLHKQIKL